MNKKPIGVVLSDLHFSLKTNLLAESSLKVALAKAEALKVPLILTGDVNDTKAIIRGECVITIVNVLAEAKVPVKVLIGNHDRLHEKDERHSLEFLRPYVEIIQSPVYDDHLDAFLIPYHHDSEVLQALIKDLSAERCKRLIMHQGVKTAFMGEYSVDKTSIDPVELADFAVISGHYHRRQSIITDGRKHDTNFGVGTFNYIGTAYTVTFAEANDGPKGFQILYSDFSMELVPINLRKHVIVERDLENVMHPIEGLKSEDLLWLKVRGSSTELDKLKKKAVGDALIGHQSFKLDKISTDVEAVDIDVDQHTDEEILDMVIEQANEPSDQQDYLKALWRELLK